MRRTIVGLGVILLAAGCGETETDLLGGQGLAQGGCHATNDLPLLHWAPGSRCLRVTYDPALAEHAEALAKALETWSALECSGLCFQAPVEADLDLDVDHPGYMHFAAQPSDLGQAISSQLVFELDTREIFYAVTFVDEELLSAIHPELLQAAWTGAVGDALALITPPRGERSVLASWEDDLAPEPTDLDVQRFCNLYGEGGVCEIRPAP